MIAGAAVSGSLHSEVNMPNWVLCAVVAVDKKQVRFTQFQVRF
jgi:hypothetical protein